MIKIFLNCLNSGFAPDIERVIKWAQDTFPKCRWIFEVIEVNDD